MDRRRPKLTQSREVGLGPVSHVARETVATVNLIVIDHQSITVFLRDNRSGCNRSIHRIAVDNGGLRKRNSGNGAGID